MCVIENKNRGFRRRFGTWYTFFSIWYLVFSTVLGCDNIEIAGEFCRRERGTLYTAALVACWIFLGLTTRRSGLSGVVTKHEMHDNGKYVTLKYDEMVTQIHNLLGFAEPNRRTHASG